MSINVAFCVKKKVTNYYICMLIKSLPGVEKLAAGEQSYVYTWHYKGNRPTVF